MDWAGRPIQQASGLRSPPNCIVPDEPASQTPCNWPRRVFREEKPRRLDNFGTRTTFRFAAWALNPSFRPVTSVATYLRPAARWLAVLALGFHIVWVPVHLLTEAHHDSGLAHSHAEAHADQHGHSHGEPNSHGDDGDGDADQHHFASDHESKVLGKRHALLFAPTLVTWQVTLLPPPLADAHALPVNADPAPPPADSPPPSGPRAPPLG